MTTGSADITDTLHCPACGAANNCGIAQGAEHCWCMTEPVGAPLPTSNSASCYCRDCLRAQSLEQNSVQLQKPSIPR